MIDESSLDADSVPTRQLPAASTPAALPALNFLMKDEPGGVDDVDTWLMVTVAMIPVGSIVRQRLEIRLDRPAALEA